MPSFAFLCNLPCRVYSFEIRTDSLPSLSLSPFGTWASLGVSVWVWVWVSSAPSWRRAEVEKLACEDCEASGEMRGRASFSSQRRHTNALEARGASIRSGWGQLEMYTVMHFERGPEPSSELSRPHRLILPGATSRAKRVIGRPGGTGREAPTGVHVHV